MSERFNSNESQISPVVIDEPQVGQPDAGATAVLPGKIAAQNCGGDEATACGAVAAPPSYVYAIGRLRPAFPSLSVEQEFYQAIGRPSQSNGAAAVPDNALAYNILSLGQNLYIAREMCWVLQIDGKEQVGLVDAYLVLPRTYVELYEMILTLEPVSGEKRYDVVIGPRGPVASPEMCAGLQLPTVLCNQIYSFTFNQFVDEMYRTLNPVAGTTVVSRDVIDSMFTEMLKVADNAGETDEHRAINYLILRYPQVYKMASEMLHLDESGLFEPGAASVAHTLTGVDARPAGVQGVRRVIDVIFRYRNRTTGEIIYSSCSVDVTGQFPFLVRPMSRYYPHP